jgi:hypothetical protein
MRGIRRPLIIFASRFGQGSRSGVQFGRPKQSKRAGLVDGYRVPTPGSGRTVGVSHSVYRYALGMELATPELLASRRDRPGGF